MKKKTKVAFLDRDGVINSCNSNKNYIGSIKDFKWLKGSKKTIKYLKSIKYKVVIVTNQSGVARGYFTINDVHQLHRYLKNELKKYGTKVNKSNFISLSFENSSKSIISDCLVGLKHQIFI